MTAADFYAHLSARRDTLGALKKRLEADPEIVKRTEGRIYASGTDEDYDDDLPPGPGYCHFCGADTGEACADDCECGMCEGEPL